LGREGTSLGQPTASIVAHALTGGEGFRETWSPPTPDLLEDVRALAVANREGFNDELERLRQRLSASQPSDE
jgi:hypothetical protein